MKLCDIYERIEVLEKELDELYELRKKERKRILREWHEANFSKFFIDEGPNKKRYEIPYSEFPEDLSQEYVIEEYMCGGGFCSMERVNESLILHPYSESFYHGE
jgi:glutathione peroxidase-family protein